MGTILFIHGTGQRHDSVVRSLAKIRDHAKDQPVLKPFAVENCLWGDPYGTQIGKGLSVPDYAQKGGLGQPDPKELDIQLWANLYADPLYELRLLALQPSRTTGLPGPSAGNRLDDYLARFTVPPDLHANLAKGDVLSVFERARTEVSKSAPYQEMLQVASDPLGAFQDALARALLAMAIALFREAEGGTIPAIQEDRKLRDASVQMIRDCLGPYQAAVGESLIRRLQKLGDKVYWGMPTALLAPGTVMWGLMAQRRRGEMMDGASPLAGDVLLYQCRGEQIRKLIAFRMRELTPPVVIIAHSLGGVAAVDVLVRENLKDRVGLLVTVGSQAPYFYEINALQSLERHPDASLPPHFPPWINIYDRRDFLSFVGADLFPGRLTDHAVDSWLPFPISHSAYWTNPDTFEIIAAGVRQYLGTAKP